MLSGEFKSIIIIFVLDSYIYLHAVVNTVKFYYDSNLHGSNGNNWSFTLFRYVAKSIILCMMLY